MKQILELQKLSVADSGAVAVISSASTHCQNA